MNSELDAKVLDITVKRKQVFNAVLSFFDDDGEPIDLINLDIVFTIFKKVPCAGNCQDDISFYYEPILHLYPVIIGPDNNQLQFNDDITLSQEDYKYNLTIQGDYYLTGAFKVNNSYTKIFWPDKNIKEPTYSVYSAMLIQSGEQAPVPEILENTIGDIIWTRDSTGLYKGTLNGAFIISKTVVPPFGNFSGQSTAALQIYDFSGTIQGYYVIYQNNNGNDINIISTKTDGSAADLETLTGVGGGIFIEIRVYK